MKTLLERDYVKLIYSPEKKHLTQRWLGFANIKQFKEAIDATVTISEKNDVKKILSDTRQQAVVKKEATDYAASVMPLLIKNGLKKMAF
ncbi:MAG: hypothetical protein GY756_13205 [bacterium]|nr:hypothetical protein [bacterium]